MERRRIQRKQAFLRFEIEALRELPRKLGWVDWLWLLGELLLAVIIVRSCNGWTSSNAHYCKPSAVRRRTPDAESRLRVRPPSHDLQTFRGQKRDETQQSHIRKQKRRQGRGAAQEALHNDDMPKDQIGPNMQI